MTDEDIHYEMTYNADGVSISKYDLVGMNHEPVLLDEMWFTWNELFIKLVGEPEHAPTIKSGN